MTRLAFLVVLAACSKSDTAPPAPGKPPAASATTPAGDDSAAGMCTRMCKKALGCAGVGDDQIAPCVESCTPSAPDPAKVQLVEAASCAEVMAILNGPNTAAPRAAPARCTADCSGCTGDGTSCYKVAGGANGIPCDDCCCAPGGPAPVWK